MLRFASSRARYYKTARQRFSPLFIFGRPIVSKQTSVRKIQATALRKLISGTSEHAILDVREGGQAFDRHLLFSAPAPLGRLAHIIDRLVPRRNTTIVLVDKAGEYTTIAAQRLLGFGYTDVAILDGGVDAWEKAGFELFSGTNVPTKAFGEVIEHQLHTPNISARSLKALQDANADLVILDSRPLPEFQNFSIPGALDCAGAELVYRALEAAPSPDTLVVVNCAGRTRSILGAQSLINAGIPNPVAALTGGSMAWLLDGLVLDHGKIRTAPRPSAKTLADAQKLASNVAKKTDVRVIDAATLATFDAERATRTLYRFDVRDPVEYEAGHEAGWRSAAGGQLVQAIDDYAATRRARVVLTDNDGVRARLTASWLQQLGGYEVYVLDDPKSSLLESGPEPVRVLRSDTNAVKWIEPSALAEQIDDADLKVFDIDDSLAFRKQHVRGAHFVAATVVGDFLAIVQAKRLVLTSRDGVLASLLAPQIADAARQFDVDVQVLLGGNARWKALGLPTASGDAGNLTGQTDRRYGAYDVAPAEAPQEMRNYLDWELQLVAQLERDGSAEIVVRDFETGTAGRSYAVLQGLEAKLGKSSTGNKSAHTH
jgi:rhodanese-related sulfurtransferase